MEDGGGDHARYRRWLGRKLARNRGLASALAKEFGYQRNWLGRFVKGGPKAPDIPFKRACDLAARLNASLADVVKVHDDKSESITLPSDIVDALSDPRIMGAVEAMGRVDEEYLIEVVQILRGAARLPPVLQTVAPNTETNPAANTTREPKRRR